MKLFVLFSVIAATCYCRDAQVDLGHPYKPLYEVKGDVQVTPNRSPRTVQINKAYSEDFKKVRTPENCVFPLEVVIIQDATASFQDDFEQMKGVQLQLMLNDLIAKHPGSTVGVVSHRDKPIYPLGTPDTDYCVKFELPLTSDLNALTATYGSMISTGGADPPENAFGAMVAALQSPTPGWANPLATKMIVVATDAPPHFSNDTSNIFGLPPFSGMFDEANAAAQCLSEYYPSPEQVKKTITDKGAYSAFLVFDGSEQNNLVLRSWQWVNTYLAQPTEFLNAMANDASDFWAKLQIAIAAIEQIECEIPPPTDAPVTPIGSPQVTTPTLPPTPPPTLPTTLPMTTLPPVTTPPGSVLPPPVTATATAIPPPVTATETALPPCVCPPCPLPGPCDPCPCNEGVLIKLKYRPQRLRLEVIDNPLSVVVPGNPADFIPGKPADVIPGSPLDQQSVANVLPNVVPDVLPEDVVPNVVPKDVVPNVVPQGVVPNVVPQDVVPNVVPQGVVPKDVVPNVVPYVVPKDVVPNVVPNVVPQEVVPKVVP